jgi:hypothetical protein
MLVELERGGHEVAHALDVERVAAHDVLAELEDGAGELAEQQDARLVTGRLAGDELLGDEVHPVLERGDAHHVGETVVRRELLAGHPRYR